MMKVIGKTDNGYILTATADDIAAIQGMYRYEAETEEKIDIGTEVDCEGLFRKYRNIAFALDDITALKEKTCDLVLKSAEWIELFREGES